VRRFGVALSSLSSVVTQALFRTNGVIALIGSDQKVNSPSHPAWNQAGRSTPDTAPSGSRLTVTR
jgi:hypothetical protein